MQRKKLLIGVLAITLLVGVVSAAVVNYLSNTIRMQANVSSPITLSWIDVTDPNYIETDMNGGDARFYVAQIVNYADLPINGKVQIHISRWNPGGWWEDFDSAGLYLAWSTDISYAWVSAYNPGGLGWRDWLSTYPDWMDWVLAPDDTTKFNTAYISPVTLPRDGWLGGTHDAVDPDGDRDERITMAFAASSWTSSVMPIDPGTFYTVFWVIADPALQPTSYHFSITIIPP